LNFPFFSTFMPAAARSRPSVTAYLPIAKRTVSYYSVFSSAPCLKVT